MNHKAFTLIEIMFASIISGIVLLGIIQTSVSLLKNKQNAVNSAMLSKYAQNILNHMLQDASKAVGHQEDPAVVSSLENQRLSVCFNQGQPYDFDGSGEHSFICYSLNDRPEIDRNCGGIGNRPDPFSLNVGCPRTTGFSHVFSLSVRSTAAGWSSAQFYDLAVTGQEPFKDNNVPGSGGIWRISTGWRDANKNQTGMLDVIVETCLDPSNPISNPCVVYEGGVPKINADGSHESANNPYNPYAIKRGSIAIVGQSLN